MKPQREACEISEQEKTPWADCLSNETREKFALLV